MTDARSSNQGADGNPDDAGRPSQSADKKLSERENSVLGLMADGKALKEIGPILRISIKTVESHKRAIMGKLNLYTTAQLTKYALAEGLTSPDPWAVDRIS